MMETDQEQALSTKILQKNQVLFRRCTAVDGSIKNEIVTAVQKVFLSQTMDHLTGFEQETALDMLQHILWSYRSIDKIDIKVNAVKNMDPYDPTEPLVCLIVQLEMGRRFSIVRVQTIADAMMVSKGTILLTQTAIFNGNISELRQKSTKLKTWETFKTFFYKAHREQRRAVTTKGKGVNASAVHNIYIVPSPP